MFFQTHLTRSSWYFLQTVSGLQIHVTGQWELDGKQQSGHEMAAAFTAPQEESIHSFKQIITRANGNFAVVILSRNHAFLATDQIRSYPLFYHRHGNTVTITDRVGGCREQDHVTLAENSLHEFLSSGFVYEGKTIYRELTALQAGEFVRIDGMGRISSRRYLRFLPDLSQHTTVPDEFPDQADHLLLDVFRRLLASCPPAARLVLPLSGGYDSRLIANYLYRLGVRDVLCFSYGTSDDTTEVPISREVARRLNYEWHFVEYTPELWHEVIASEETEQYLRFACSGVSLPHLQDYPAIRELKRRGVLKAGDIIIPGHTGDFLFGNHLLPELFQKNFNPLHLLARRHTLFWLPDFSNRRSLRTVLKNNREIPADVFFETFNWQERQAKFIVNSIRVYEWFGFDWRLPLWDKELMLAWARVPAPLRYRRRLFRQLWNEKFAVSQLRDYPTSHEPEADVPEPFLKFTLIKFLIAFPLLKIPMKYLFSGRYSVAPHPLLLHEYFSAATERVGDYFTVPEMPGSIRRRIRREAKRRVRSAYSNGLLAAYTLKVMLSPTGKPGR